MDQAEVMVSELMKVGLPSKGMLYGDKLPDGVLHVRPLSTREEKMLISSRVRSGQLMYDIVSGCIRSEDKVKMPFEQYLVGDVVYLFLMIRTATYGADYMFMPSCKYCQKPIKIEIRVPYDLGIYVLEPGFSEPFETVLPVSKKKLGLRLFRIADEQDVQNYEKVRENRGEENPGYVYRIAKHIVNVGGNPYPIEEACEFVERLHARDTEAIREAIINVDCGVDLQLERQCEGCGRVNDVFFEFTPDFFRSNNARVRRRRGTVG